LSVATKLTKSCPLRPESKITTGMFRCFASATGAASALSSSGASAMPETPRLTNPSTSETCASRSSSRSGPRQITETPSSCAALFAPAWMLCQKTCDVPFGITAIVRPDAARAAVPAGALSGAHPAQTSSSARAALNNPLQSRDWLMVSSTEKIPRPHRRTAEYSVALRGGALAQKISDDVHGSCVIGRQRAHRPVRTDHQAIGAEAVEGDFEVRPQLIGCPRPPIRFGHEAGHLAADVA